MKIGYYCEAPADQAAMAVFVEGILGVAPEPICLEVEARGLPGFFRALDIVVRGVHFNSDADGLVIVVDSDRSEIHALNHDVQANADTCRYCRVQ